MCFACFLFKAEHFFISTRARYHYTLDYGINERIIDGMKRGFGRMLKATDYFAKIISKLRKGFNIS